MEPFDDLDLRATNAIRILAVDQVEQAKSGHPGLPLGAAPMAYALWSRALRFDPRDPTWPDRDRFVLSAGHGSALLYALLHVFGYELPLAELMRFRQWGSRTPGHPEHGLTPGVEVTTGPLGQGFAAAVGMALAERHLAAHFNRDGFPVVDHRTWVLASDGDLMEGISHEAASLAGHLRLERLSVLYDDNHITIDGSTALSFSEDVPRRFEAYGWRVLEVADGNDLWAIAAALDEARRTTGAPTLIRIRTHIGFGSPKQDTSEAHGSPLGAAAAAATRQFLGWEITAPFSVPDGVRQRCQEAAAAGGTARAAWLDLHDRYRAAHPELAAELGRRLAGDLPIGWDEGLPAFETGSQVATRDASGRTLNALAASVPELLGGSADLAGSTCTNLRGLPSVSAGDYGGRNVHFGIREHAMAAICNGLALHGGVRPFGATFLVFADYLRPALRLAALQHLPVTYVFTHDSLAVGEDGPTHQPIEQIVSLRIVPNTVVLRPADANETVQAWSVALARRDGPTALLLTRQKLPVLAPPLAGAVARGAWVRAEAQDGAPAVVLIATGSEVALALAARDRLETIGIGTRVVSAPSLELFAQQSKEYQGEVLGPRHALRVAVEMGRGQGWHRWVGDGEVISLGRFGASAPAAEVTSHLGYSVEAVVERVQSALARRLPTAVGVSVPTPLVAHVAACRDTLREQGAIARLTARDSALWGDGFSHDVARRLGWLDLPGRSRAEVPRLAQLTAHLAAEARTLFLLGMGGSSLTAEVLRRVGGNPSGRDLIVVDTTDPDRVGPIIDGLDPATSAVVAVSKSGTTAETSALLELFWQAIARAIPEGTGRRFLAVTEPGTALARLAESRRFAAVVGHPVDVGGRFSAVSSVGLIPALWLGLDAEQLADGGDRALAGLTEQHAAVELATCLGATAQSGWGKLLWHSSPSLRPLAAWAEQLVAESTGKGGRGILPVVPAQAPERCWPGTVVLSPRWVDDDAAALDATCERLAGHAATVRWPLRRDGLGEAFVTLEIATALAGLLLGVNPFDEPDVVRAKDAARAALGGGALAYPAPTDNPGSRLIDRLVDLGQDDAVVLLAYLREDPEIEVELARLATAASDRYSVPVTWAFGPRYLHSTGQLHKGGPASIHPVILTGEPRRDIAIPGQRHTLGQLRWAQALGDLQALHEVGRRPLHLHLGGEARSGLVALVDAMVR